MAVDSMSGVGGLMLRSQLSAESMRGARETSGVGQGAPVGAVDEADGPGFGDALEHALGRVAAAQATADGKTVALLTGQDMPIHEVMIAVTEAELAVQTTTAVAAKAIQAYQEIWRLDV